VGGALTGLLSVEDLDWQPAPSQPIAATMTQLRNNPALIMKYIFHIHAILATRTCRNFVESICAALALTGTKDERDWYVASN
jgi:hypothetical protein